MKRHRIVLEPGRSQRQYWRDLWGFRELLFQLMRRDIAVHYKQTIIGGAWAIIRPLMAVVVLTVVFSRVAKLQADGAVWYPLFVLAGMLPWQFFASILGESANSLVNNPNLISKVYFPRLLVPLSTVGVPLVDMMVLIPFLIALMIYAAITPPWQVVFAPLFLALTAVMALAFGLGLCALNVRYRDVRYVIPTLLQFGVYLSPIGFATSKVPSELQFAFHLNPMVFAIDGLRWTMLGVGDPFAGGGWLVSLAVMAAAIWAAIRYFRATEKTFADVI